MGAGRPEQVVNPFRDMAWPARFLGPSQAAYARARLVRQGGTPWSERAPGVIGSTVTIVN